jgi:hypothetical protein
LHRGNSPEEVHGAMKRCASAIGVIIFWPIGRIEIGVPRRCAFLGGGGFVSKGPRARRTAFQGEAVTEEAGIIDFEYGDRRNVSG